MKRPRSPWAPLIEAEGTRADLARSLGVSLSTIGRYISGGHAIDATTAENIAELAAMHEVPNPLETTPRRRQLSLDPLRKLGIQIMRGRPKHEYAAEIERLRGVFPNEQLAELANSDGPPIAVHAAVMALLED